MCFAVNASGRCKKGGAMMQYNTIVVAVKYSRYYVVGGRSRVRLGVGRVPMRMRMCAASNEGEQ